MIKRSFSGVGNSSQTFSTPMTKFGIINDGEDTLSFTINGITITVMINESFEDDFDAFTTVDISAPGPWRAYVEGADQPFNPSVAKLFVSLRYEIKDIDKKIFSDYELLNALNSVLTMVNNAMNNLNSGYIVTDTVLTMTNNKSLLPQDFESVVSVYNGENELQPLPPSAPLTDGCYKILNNALYAQADSLTLTYRFNFPEVVSMTDKFPLPLSFSELVKKYMKIVLMGMDNQDAVIVKQLADDVYSISAGREYSSIPLSYAFSL